MILDECTSTNEVAIGLAEAGAPHGTWVSARRQTRGRGRQGRSWISDEGNLFLSVVLRIPDTRFWSWVPIMVGAAALDAVKQSGVSLPLRLKWPNDLVVVPEISRDDSGNFMKAGGILCESRSGASGFIVAGIGLNCRTAPHDVDLRSPAVSLGCSADALRPGLLASILRYSEELAAQGPGTVREEYERSALFTPGVSVQWNEGGTGELKCGRVVGLGEYGELRVEFGAGTVQSLLSEEVSLRVFRTAAAGSLL